MACRNIPGLAMMVIALGVGAGGVAEAALTPGWVVIGDSYSAEHRFAGARFRHRNWVEQIGDNGGGDLVSGSFNFGTYTTDFSLFGSPRLEGFEYNWALSGATTAQAVSDQLPGAVLQLQTVADIGIVNVGVNDFCNSFDPAAGDYVSPAAAASAAVANVQQIIDQLSSATSKIVVANIVDRAAWPSNAGVDPVEAGKVRAAIEDANRQITYYANGLGIPVFDQLKLLETVSSGTFDFAGVTIQAGREDGFPSGGSAPDYAYADGGHPGTLFHGLAANSILHALDLGYEDIIAADVPLLTAQDILDNAYAPIFTTPPTAEDFSFDYGDFVITDLILGDANNDGKVSGLDVISVQANFGSGGAADGFLLGDANDDGFVSGLDLIAVQENFGLALPGSALPALLVPEPVAAAPIAVIIFCRRPRRCRHCP